MKVCVLNNPEDEPIPYDWAAQAYYLRPGDNVFQDESLAQHLHGKFQGRGVTFRYKSA